MKCHPARHTKPVRPFAQRVPIRPVTHNVKKHGRARVSHCVERIVEAFLLYESTDIADSKSGRAGIDHAYFSRCECCAIHAISNLAHRAAVSFCSHNFSRSRAAGQDEIRFAKYITTNPLKWRRQPLMDV